MARKESKRLVIDANIARSAGTSDNPRSAACRESLLTVLQICHRIVLNRQLAREWREHKSTFSEKWLATMQKKGKVVSPEATPDSELDEQIRSAAADHAKGRAIRKDQHLVLAARATDQIVISMDEEARHAFASIVDSVPEIEKLCWANPSRVDDLVVKWLIAGAAPEKRRWLGGTK